MDFDSLNNPDIPLTRNIFNSGVVNGAIIDENLDVVGPGAGPQENNANYAVPFQEKENELYKLVKEGLETNASNLEQLEHISCSLATTELLERNLQDTTEIYRRFKFNYNLPSVKLAVADYKDEIIDMIKSNNVVVIRGHTGCGKSTQIPQFILDHCRANSEQCNIVVTQPRRIAAISVAQRVCDERAWRLGSVCGYQVGLDPCKSSDTILSYETTGVLLNRLISMKNLNIYTHIIVDEVHERTQDMDFLLILIRRFLFTNSCGVKVILMSATFDTDAFSKYFQNISGNDFLPAPLIDIDSSSKSSSASASSSFAQSNLNFKTVIFYINQFEALGVAPDFKVDLPEINSKTYDIFVGLIKTFDHTDPIISNVKPVKRKIGHVLVFLPGILEIEEAFSRLQAAAANTRKIFNHDEEVERVEWVILPLHSSITREEQKRVFISPPAGYRKIILSTNIAESSITVPDIYYVVDFCLTKTMIANQHSQYSSLKLEWASQTNCTQRSGRVGRVSDGRVYRLVPKGFYENKFHKDNLPEILRSPLERVVLYSKMLDVNESPKAILALCMNPPNLSNIMNTICSLKEVGALLPTCEGIPSTTDGDLTYLGKIMALLPVDVRLSKLMILGHMFSCLEQCIIIAAGLSIQNIFAVPFQEHFKAYRNKLHWADGTGSDLFAYLSLYKVWVRLHRNGTFGKNTSEREWIKQFYLNERSMKEWALLIKELKDRLYAQGIKDEFSSVRIKLGPKEESLCLKVVMCGAFYPNYFVRSSDGGQIDEREAVKTLGGRDPYNTVYYTNFDSNQPGCLYVQRIKALLKDCSTEMTVSFDNSSKVYVEFPKYSEPDSMTIGQQSFMATVPGKIVLPVFLACRKRQLKIEARIPLLRSDEAWIRANKFGITENVSRNVYIHPVSTSSQNPTSTVIPGLDCMAIQLVITSITDAGHFWAHNVNDDLKKNLHDIHQALNKKPLESVEGNVRIGDSYAAPYVMEGQKIAFYYRAKVLAVKSFGLRGDVSARIIFIDFGNYQIVALHDLKHIPFGPLLGLEPQAIECSLTGIQPSHNQKAAIFSIEASEFLEQQTQNSHIYGKVYSVVNNIVSLELFTNSITNAENDVRSMSINELLIKHKFAQKSEESFLSKQNHERRIAVQNSSYVEADLTQVQEYVSNYEREIDAPDERECKYEIKLRGPFSPLETKVFSILEGGLSKRCVIEGSSVNAVLLDTDPQDPHERLLVAEGVGQNVDGSNLNLRHTVLMPNTVGFPMLMSLLFCPRMELKPLPDGSRFASILCGLGCDKERKFALYPQHDMILTLDTELRERDLNHINEIRFYMNAAIDCLNCNVYNMEPTYLMNDCQQNLNRKLFELLNFERKSVDRVCARFGRVWGKYDYTGTPLECGETYLSGAEIWPLHSSFKLANCSDHVNIIHNLNELQEMARSLISFSKTTCIICEIELHSIITLRIHISSQQHRSKLEELDEEIREALSN